MIQELLSMMTENLPDNVKLQISLENTENDRVIETKLLNKNDMVLKVSEWVSLFIDYYDMNVEDISFKLLAVEIRSGGRRVNSINTVEGKRSIIRLQNSNTICLARAIVGSLAINNREKLQSIFKNALTPDELKQINKTRQNRSQINEGVISDNEIQYVKKGRELQGILAKILHRLCQIEIKENGNDFQDAKVFAERLDIEIQIYNLESRAIYLGKSDKSLHSYV